MGSKFVPYINLFLYAKLKIIIFLLRKYARVTYMFYSNNLRPVFVSVWFVSSYVSLATTLHTHSQQNYFTDACLFVVYKTRLHKQKCIDFVLKPLIFVLVLFDYKLLLKNDLAVDVSRRFSVRGNRIFAFAHVALDSTTRVRKKRYFFYPGYVSILTFLLF